MKDRLLPLLALCALSFAGCGDDTKITVYRIPKETKPEAAPGAEPGAGEKGPAVRWMAPAGWEEQPASGFRKGSFLVRGENGSQADVSVISFPQSAGGLLANVNRWREQLKLSTVTEPSQTGTTLMVDGHEIFFVDLVSDQPLLPDGSKSRILAGVLSLPDETWFFKMAGPDALVESQRDSFRQFLQSIRAAGTPSSASAGASTNAPTAPPIEAAASGSRLQYKVPSGWQEKPLSPMRLASFKAVAPDGKEADVSVVSLPGIAGGDLANVNRWRGQVQLSPIDEDALAQSAEHVRANGHDYLVVDLVSAAPPIGQNQKQRILGAILDENRRAWFVKMTGDDATVAGQRDAFREFLRSLVLPNE